MRTLGKKLEKKKGSFLDKIFMRGVKRKLRKYKRIRIKVVVGCGGGKDDVNGVNALTEVLYSLRYLHFSIYIS